MMKDTLERAREPNLNLQVFLQTAYMHPVFKAEERSGADVGFEESEKEPELVPTKRRSKYSGSFSSSRRPLVFEEDDNEDYLK